jgi:hypothetical protein
MGQCKRCKEGDDVKGIAIALAFVAALFGACVVAMRWHWRQVREQAAHARALSHADLMTTALKAQSERMQKRVATVQKGKILISFIQCVYRVSQVFEIKFPKEVLAFYGALGIALFNWVPFLPLGCAMRADYFLGLYAMTMGPLVAIALLVVAEMAYNKCSGHGHGLLRLKYSPSVILFLTFAVYTATCTSILGYFHCVELEDRHVYLISDKSVKCTDTRYLDHAPYVYAMGVLYSIGTPLFYTCLLLKHRAAIMGSADGRAQTESIQSILFLWGAYKPKWYLMEVWDMIRKLCLTCLPMLLKDSSSVVAGGLVWVLLSLAIYQYSLPYVDGKDNTLMQMTQYQLLFTLFLGLLVKLEVDAQENWDQNTLCFCLIASTLCIILISLGMAVTDHTESIQKLICICCCRRRSRGQGKLSEEAAVGIGIKTTTKPRKKGLVPPKDVQRKRNKRLAMSTRNSDNKIACCEEPTKATAAAYTPSHAKFAAFVDRLALKLDSHSNMRSDPKINPTNSATSTAPSSSRVGSFRDIGSSCNADGVKVTKPHAISDQVELFALDDDKNVDVPVVFGDLYKTI